MMHRFDGEFFGGVIVGIMLGAVLAFALHRCPVNVSAIDGAVSGSAAVVTFKQGE